MTCPQCGEDVRPGQKFCANCGHALIASCASCGASLTGRERFCPDCGTPVTPRDASEPGVEGHDPSALEAAVRRERRQVSVLFADLVGFTSAADSRDPEATRDFQERYFSLCRDVIARYGGTVEKFIGDAVMAVWGAPTAHEDDAERAVRAALDVVASVALLPAIGDAPPAARAAVGTGEAAVAVGAVGQGLVTGDIVNTVARVQALADPGTVLVDETTQRASSAAIAFESAREVEIRGKAGRVRIWQAGRIVAGRGGTGRTDTIEPPFIGRDAELAVLKELFHATSRERRLRVVSITGIGGIGKSRLVWELEKYLDGVVEDIAWHQGRSPAYGEGLTFWALGEMVRRRARILEDDGEDVTRAKLAATLDAWLPDADERAWIEPRLLALLGVEESRVSDRGELFVAWRTFLERIADRATTVLVFEDLQWADDGLIDFIEHVMEWSRSRPILVVTLSRPELLERRASWGAGQRNFTSMHLEPLTDEAMRALLLALVPDLPRPAVRSILRRAEGVPLYAVETVRMLVADGTIAHENGEFRLVREVGELSIPETLHALVAARLDALQPTDRALLQSAAVLGQSFAAPALAAVSGDSVEELTPRLDALVRAELLTRESDPRSPERGQYQFMQSVLREVAHGTLALKDRRERHLAAARYFETLGEEGLAGALAEHYYEAYRAASGTAEADALAAQARVALRAAAQRARALGSPQQALGFLRRAVEVAKDPFEQVALLETAGHTAIDGDQLEAAVAFFEDAEGRAAAIGDTGTQTRAIAGAGRARTNMGRPDEATGPLEARARTLPGDDDADAAVLLAELSRVYMLTADDRALEFADRALAVAERLDLVEIAADALVTKGTVLGRTRPREGAALLHGAIELGESHNLPWVLRRGLNNLMMFIEGDDPGKALELGNRGIEMARRIGSMAEVVNFTAGIGFARLSAGDLRGARTLTAQVDDDAIMGITGIQMAWVISAVGTLLEHEGDVARGAALVARLLPGIRTPQLVAGNAAGEAWTRMFRGRLDEAEPFVRRFFEAGTEPFWGPDLLGHFAVRSKRLDLAREALAELEGAVRPGRVGLGHVLGLRGLVAALQGRPDEGRSLHGDAVRLFLELDQAFTAGELQLEWAIVRAGTSDGTAAGEAARDAFDRMGARAYVRQLDALLATGPPVSRREPTLARTREAEPA